MVFFLMRGSTPRSTRTHTHLRYTTPCRSNLQKPSPGGSADPGHIERQPSRNLRDPSAILHSAPVGLRRYRLARALLPWSRSLEEFPLGERQLLFRAAWSVGTGILPREERQIPFGRLRATPKIGRAHV